MLTGEYRLRLCRVFIDPCQTVKHKPFLPIILHGESIIVPSETPYLNNDNGWDHLLRLSPFNIVWFIVTLCGYGLLNHTKSLSNLPCNKKALMEFLEHKSSRERCRYRHGQLWYLLCRIAPCYIETAGCQSPQKGTPSSAKPLGGARKSPQEGS